MLKQLLLILFYNFIIYEIIIVFLFKHYMVDYKYKIKSKYSDFLDNRKRAAAITLINKNSKSNKHNIKEW